MLSSSLRAARSGGDASYRFAAMSLSTACRLSTSMPRKPQPAPKMGPRKPLSEELARDAISHEEPMPDDKVG